MSRYAANTSVGIEKSRLELERTVSRYGCSQFMSGWDSSGRGMIGFTANGRQVRIMVGAPLLDEFKTSPAGRRRTPAAQREAFDQECRRRWRAFVLVLKAKFEAVASGIASFEDEFMAYIALPNGETVGQFMRPQLEAAYASGKMPLLLPELASGGKP